MSDAPRVFDGAPRELSLVSVVAPVYNEDATIEEFYARVCAALDGLPFELVLVDDGSTDGTPMKLEPGSPSTTLGCASSTCHGTSATRRRSPPGSTTPAATPW